MFDVVSFGEFLIDFVALDGSADEPQMKAMVGGAPGNFAAAVQAYGGQAALIGKVGKDAFGDLLIHRFSQLGIETRGIVQDESVFTTLAFVTLSGDGERSFSFARKPGADTYLREDECDFALVDQTKVFHFGSLSLTHEPSRSATYAAISRAKSMGKLITYDPNLRLPLWNSPETAKEYIIWGLDKADVVKISDDEVRFLFDCDEQQGAEILLKKYGVKLIFVTCGASGCWFAAEGCSGFVPAPEVCAIDTTGAGDIFFGAVVSRLLKSDAPLSQLTEEVLRSITAFGCTAASLSTLKHGGIASIPPESEILAHVPELVRLESV